MAQYLAGSYQPDPTDPSMGTAKTIDGRSVTVNKAEFDRDEVQQAEPLANNPLAMPAPEPMGPPPPPAPAEPPPEMTEQDLVQGVQDANRDFGGEQIPGVQQLDTARGFMGEGMEATPLGEGQDPDAFPDSMRPNMADVVQPATPGGMAPFSEMQGGTTSESTTGGQSIQETQTGETPEERAARIEQSSSQLADATQQRVFSEADAARKSTEAVQAHLAELEKKHQAVLAEAEASKAVHERYSKALAETQIDPDDYMSVGERITSVATLMLSGFIQGVTGGRNPALNQMLKMYEHRRDQWVAQQLREKDTKLSLRRDMMRSDEAAISSAKAQIDATLKAKIENEARLAGLPDPGPVAAEAMAKIDLDSQEHQARIMGEAQKQITTTAQKALQESQQSQATQRQTEGTPEVRQMDQALRGVGSDRKRWQEATSEKGANLGHKMEASKMLGEYSQLLSDIAAKNGGKLPTQEVISLDNYPWLRRKMAQMGNLDSKQAVRSESLLAAVEMELKKTLNSKMIDGEKEAETLKNSYNTGETSTTLERLREIASMSRRDMEQAAQAYADDPVGFLELLEMQTGTSHSVRSAEKETIRRGFIPLDRGQEPAPEQAPDTDPQEQGPLGFNMEKDSFRRAVQQEAQKANLNPEALMHVVQGESGGRGDAVNPFTKAHGGIIQFSKKYWPGFAKSAGRPDVTWEQMLKMSPEEQLPFAIAYFKNAGVGPDDGPEEYNLAAFMPAALKDRKPDDFVLGRKGSDESVYGLSMHKVWEQNPGLRDPNDPSVVTVGSAKRRGK